MEDAVPATHVELFALQPRLSLEDYDSPAAFARKHRALAQRVSDSRARDSAGTPLHPALVVWPEWVGAPLGMMGQLPRLRHHPTARRAMRSVALFEWWSLWNTWKDLHPPTREEGLHALRAARVHQVMHETFSAIARDFGLWVVAGSAWLPSNRRGLDTPDFTPHGARTFNTSYTFAPGGFHVATTRKVNLVPTREDTLRLSPGRPEDLSVIATPFGRLATVLGYDAFPGPLTSHEPYFVPCARYCDALRADILAHPSSALWPMSRDAGRTPRRDDVLTAELSSFRNIRYTVTAQPAGTLFEHTFEAPSLILERTAEGSARVLARSEHPGDEDLLHVTVPACPR
ncbi:carbon-nitrogen hydrolase family protein [Myxococcus stipitatus]|uniref:nitrilase-related carbon-nitrogen hydrolase n=1 Tax=Myxococcus stipitatus TaxID=83455 RepID=UPI00314539F3